MPGNRGRQLAAVFVVGLATVVLALSVPSIGDQIEWGILGGRLVALTLLLAGVVLWFAGRPLAAVAAATSSLSWAGVIWSVEHVSSGDALVGAGMILAPLLVPSLVLLVLGQPALWRVSVRLRPALLVASLVIAITGVARALVYDPIRDLHCGLFCGHSPVLIIGDAGLASSLAVIGAVTTAVVCGWISLEIMAGADGRSKPSRPGLPARLMTASAMALLSVTAVLSLVQGAVGAMADDIARLVAVRAIACLAIAGGAILVGAERIGVERSLGRIGRVLSDVTDRPSAEALLRDAVGDPSLSVGYWVDDVGYVGIDGRPVPLTAPDRQQTELMSRGRPIAIVLHDTNALPDDLLEAHIGSEARLAIQNESLELELERRVDQLRASRRRVVEAGDAARRELERDLHDGAQQLLLALSFEVRRGERSAVENGDESSAAVFAELRRVAERVLDQLRVLAHGIHPTILTSSGLEPALASYASSLATPPRLTVTVPGRFPRETEASVYAIATALIPDSPDAASMQTSIRQVGDVVRITVDGNPDVPDHVLDRLGAAGGWCEVGETGRSFVLPCG